MANDVMQKTPLLVRCMAVGPLILPLALPLQKTRVTEGESLSQVGHQSIKH
jgi:hypothetical protein